MSKQIEIKVSLCKRSGMHQPIRLRKDGFTAKKYELRSQSNYARTKRMWVKSAGVELTMFASSTQVLDHIDFIQKRHVRKDKRLDIS